MARLTLYGMMQYQADLLDGLIVPGCSKQMVRDMIIMKMGDLYPYYQIPPVLKNLITTWGLQHIQEWNRMYKTMTTEYEPLENYDRYEEWTDNASTSSNGKTNYSSTNGNNNTTENTVSAMNESSYQPSDKTTSINSGSDSGNSSNELSGKNDSKHTGHIHGNIGVTTSAQMAVEEWNLRSSHNLLDHVIKQFESTFMIQVY